MRLQLTRDSVCAGDDVDAPHPRTIFFFFAPTVEVLTDLVRSSNYLAQISGDKATWILKIGEKPVAVVAQEWARPKLLVAPNTKVSTLTASRPVEVFFEYLAQVDPESTFEEYSNKAGS